MSATPDIAVAGAGPWGLATAWLAAREGARVHVLDDGRQPAGHVAAGMLGACSEANEDERDLFDLLAAAAATWRDFASDLGAASGRDPGLRLSGTLAVATRPEHLGLLRRRAATLEGWGQSAAWLTGSALRVREPGLGTAVSGGLAFDHEHQVETRMLLAALRAAARSAGATIHLAGAVAVARDAAGRPCGLVDTAGTAHAAGTVVVAAGHGVAALAGGTPVRAVKGQILRLRAAPDAPVPIAHTIRAPSVYLTPRDDEVVVGATSEERADRRATAGGVHVLLDEALRAVPALRDMELVEVAAGLRPATYDGRPAVGADADGLVWCAGGYRNGILLTPLAARAAADAALGLPPPAWALPLAPTRFAAPGRGA